MKSAEVILHDLKERGFCVLENYWSEKKCKEALKEISFLTDEHFVVGQGGDRRCQHSNKYLQTANDFLNDKSIQAIANEYSNCSRADRAVLGIVEYKHGKVIDSGCGWHLDSDDKENQFKSFMYLTNVRTDNGPFMFIPKSRAMAKKLPKYLNLRISEENISKYFDPNAIIEITGTSGTCILVDSTHIHRGKQIQSGIRYTYTTYFYPKE